MSLFRLAIFLFLTAVLPQAVRAATWTYWVEPCSRQDTGCDAGDEQLADWALQSWAKSAEGKLNWTRVREPHSARLRIYWVGGRDGLYGEMRPVPFKGKQGAELYIRVDTRQLGAELSKAATSDKLLRDTVVFLTCLHEAGHALGLSHTTSYDDIMYSFGSGGDILEYFMRFRRQLDMRSDIKYTSAITKHDRNRLLGALVRHEVRERADQRAQ